ncbi:dTDP-4-dehydrorhamnose 3,5-epimerase [bacterium NHP-B]|nr:dTDP-4-dehydrorhamnose 3,5-epimerase [bacterium NHP-B]
MNVRKTAIEGVLVFEPKVYPDVRGRFYEGWRANAYQEAGILDAFVQDNLSISKKNVLRGLHVHHRQGQMVSIIEGQVLDVVVDVRPHSPTFRQHLCFELSSDTPQQIYMPPGYAHGFYVRSEQAILHYKATRYYDPSEEEGIAWNDPTLAIAWPTGAPILSERDQGFLPLNA